MTGEVNKRYDSDNLVGMLILLSWGDSGPGVTQVALISLVFKTLPVSYFGKRDKVCSHRDR